MKCDTIPELKKFLSIQEQALGLFSPEVATTVSKLADLYLQTGSLDEAEALYRRALSIRERLHGPHRTEVEESRRSLNKVLALKGDRLERISAEMRAGEKKSFGGTQSSAGTAAVAEKPNSSCGTSQAPTKNKRELEAWFSNTGPFRALDTETSNTYANKNKTDAAGRASFTPPSGHSNGHTNGHTNFAPHDSSTSLDAVPDHLVLTSDPEALYEAIKEAQLEVDLVRQVSGDDAPQLADALTRLADLYCRCRRYGDMEPILIEALDIREKKFGGHHQLVATSLKNLARLYYFLSRFEKALPLFERSLAIRKKVFGEGNSRVADVLEQYIKVLRKMNRHAEAHTMEQQAQAIRSRSQQWRPI